MPKIVFIYVKDGGPGGGRGKWCRYNAFGASKARTSGSSCQGRRNACGSSLHSHELRGQFWEFSSISTSPFRWWCKVISRVCRSSVFQLAHVPKYYGSYICGCSRNSSIISGKHNSSRSCTRRAKCGGTVQGQTQWRCIQTWSRSLSSSEQSYCVDCIQQVGNESKHCEEGSLLGLLRWAEDSCWKIPSCMEMCRVTHSNRCCVGFVREKEGAQGHA